MELVRVIWSDGARVYLRAERVNSRVWRVRFETGACVRVRVSRVTRMRSGVRVLRLTGEAEGIR